VKLGYGLDNQGVRVRFPAGVRDFSLLPSAQIDFLEPMQIPVQWIEGVFPRG
jgi:hypothetical protein